jgi:hypothetical protein
MGAAVVVDVALGEGSAEPAEQRSAARVGCERRATLSGAFGEAEEFRVEGVREVVAECCGARDGDGGLRQRSSIESEEALPGGVAAKRAGLGEGQFRKAKRAVEGCFLCTCWGSFGRHTEVMLRPNCV